MPAHGSRIWQANDMNPILIGFLIGAPVGAIFGMFITSVMVMAKRGDESMKGGNEDWENR
jgi:hypothetical protein